MKIESNIFKRTLQAFMFYIKNIKEITLLPLIIYLISFITAIAFQGIELLGVFENLIIATLASILSLVIIVFVFAAPLLTIISQINLLLDKKKTSIQKQVVLIKKNIFPFLKQLFFFFKYLLGIPAIILFIVVLIAYIDQLIGQLLFPIAVIFSTFFILIRTPKSLFTIFIAIDKQDFSKANIQKAQDLSSKKWWRIFGNILFISLIAGILNFIFFFGQEGITYLFPSMPLSEINPLTITMSIYNIITKTFVIGFVLTLFSFLYHIYKK